MTDRLPRLPFAGDLDREAWTFLEKATCRQLLEASDSPDGHRRVQYTFEINPERAARLLENFGPLLDNYRLDQFSLTIPAGLAADIETSEPGILRATTQRPGRVNRVPPRRSTSFAARLAGRHRLHLRNEWAALLAGEDGRGLPRGRRIRLVSGFLLAALRMRTHDLLGFAWRPVDWLLSTESRTNALITGSVGSLVIYIQATDGFHVLVTDGWEPCALLGGGLFVLARWLRRMRGIELAGRAAGEE
ncbi:hypothetical protein ACQEU8_33315 [Streptomyces sp. CA-250714]|uniref:hypothetical protein n=1 Tax=Streptomyces sp. CA-250714 TaxID=3240060 RepID=UPI003D8E2149